MVPYNWKIINGKLVYYFFPLLSRFMTDEEEKAALKYAKENAERHNPEFSGKNLAFLVSKDRRRVIVSLA